MANIFFWNWNILVKTKSIKHLNFFLILYNLGSNCLIRLKQQYRKNSKIELYGFRNNGKKRWFTGWLFEFYGISTFVGYLMPNPFSYKLSDLFQTIPFNNE